MPLLLPKPLLPPLLKKAEAEAAAITVAIATTFVIFFIISPLRVFLWIDYKTNKLMSTCNS
jgi:hypothetical protein